MNKGEPCRTPNGSNSNNEYLVNPAGQNNNNNANNSNGVAPDYRNSPNQVDTQVLKAAQSCKEGSSCPVDDRRKADADAGRAIVPAEPTPSIWKVDAVTGDRTGIGLGSQISQLIQLAVLDDLDHIIKDRMGIRCYIRYMDDMKIIHPDKEILKRIRDFIRDYLDGLGLKLSEKKTFIAPLGNGIRFLGFRYRLTETGFVVMRLEDRKISKERRKLKAQLKILPLRRVDEGYTAWKANVKQGTTYALIQRMNSFYYYHRRHHVS